VIPWSIVKGFVRFIDDGNDYHLNWKMPWVKVVGCEKDILVGESKNFILRCYPCTDVDELLLIEGESERLKAVQRHIDEMWETGSTGSTPQSPNIFDPCNGYWLLS